jgi:FkbM family methyltransferase
MKIAIQIGTNNGNDEFFNICKEEKFDQIYLIEPNKNLSTKIHEKYYGLPYKLFDIAIVPREDMRVAKLYLLNKDGTHNSLIKRKSHPIRQKVQVLPYDIVKCMTFSSFCNMIQITKIELLYIDIEGLDDEIILSIDFNKIKIQKLIWELWDHDDDDEDKLFKTGTEIQNKVKEKLLDAKYKISQPLTTWDATNLCAIKEN